MKTKVNPNQIIRFECSTDAGEDYIAYGQVISKLRGLKTHYIVQTGNGVAYVSNSKILEQFPSACIGATVQADVNGQATRWTIASISLRGYACLLYCQCCVTGNIRPFSISEVTFP